MSTSEYAVGTIGAAACGAVLYALGHGGWFEDLVHQLWSVVVPALVGQGPRALL